MTNTYKNSITFDGITVSVKEVENHFYIYDNHGCLNEHSPFLNEPNQKNLQEFFEETEEPVYM